MRFSALIAGELSDDPKVESVTVSQTRAGVPSGMRLEFELANSPGT